MDPARCPMLCRGDSNLGLLNAACRLSRYELTLHLRYTTGVPFIIKPMGNAWAMFDNDMIWLSKSQTAVILLLFNRSIIDHITVTSETDLAHLLDNPLLMQQCLIAMSKTDLLTKIFSFGTVFGDI